MSDSETVPTATDNPRALMARARAAAKAHKRPEEPLGWAEALADAPWPKGAPPAWEGDYRRAFAEALVKRGIAKPAARAGRALPSDKRPWAGRKERETTKLMRRLLSADPKEFAEQDKRAETAGLSWSNWARRKLSSAD
jgi:hypothetical protein